MSSYILLGCIITEEGDGWIQPEAFVFMQDLLGQVYRCSCNRFQTSSSLRMMDKITPLTNTLEGFKLTGLNYVNWKKKLLIVLVTENLADCKRRLLTFNLFKINFINVIFASLSSSFRFKMNFGIQQL